MNMRSFWAVGWSDGPRKRQTFVIKDLGCDSSQNQHVFTFYTTKTLWSKPTLRWLMTASHHYHYCRRCRHHHHLIILQFPSLPPQWPPQTWIHLPFLRRTSKYTTTGCTAHKRYWISQLYSGLVLFILSSQLLGYCHAIWESLLQDRTEKM